MIHGRLGFSPLEGGKLKFEDGNYDKIVSMGLYEDGTRIPSDFVGERTDKSLRLHPFYTEEPTEEQKKEMEALKDKARGKEEATDSAAGQELLEQAKKFNWDLSSAKGMKDAAAELVAHVEGKVDLPEGHDAKRKLGPLIIANMGEGPEGIVKAVIEKYGFKEQKEARAEAKQKVLEQTCENPKNAPIVQAFLECAEYYFQGKKISNTKPYHSSIYRNSFALSL